MAANSGTFGKGPHGGARKAAGRPRGVPNKFTADLKRAILEACEAAHEGGTVGYLTELAKNDKTVFGSLLGKVLPLTLAGDAENPVALTGIEIKLVKATD